jgi:hypothetical protein
MFRSLTLFNKSLPPVVLAGKDKASLFLKTNTFVPDSQPFNLQHMYGIHRDDVNLTVSYREKDDTETLWTIVSSHYVPRTAYFVNTEGEVRLFDFNHSEEVKRFSRQQAKAEIVPAETRKARLL